jgi:hypothetical protein
VAGIWGISSIDVFAAGQDGLLLHYDSRQWSQFTVSGLDYYNVVWGSSSTNVFVGGLRDDTPHWGLLRHYDGGQWPVLGGHNFGTYGTIFDISGTSATDVYFVGSESSYDEAPEEEYVRHAIRHYDGVSWTTSFESVHYYWTEGRTVQDELRGVWANAPNDVFAVGLNGRILHYDGQTWSPMTSPTTGHLSDLWGRSSNDVYAAGQAGILHYDGASWYVLAERPETCGGGNNCIWGTEADVFVVSGPVILHGRQ